MRLCNTDIRCWPVTEIPVPENYVSFPLDGGNSASEFRYGIKPGSVLNEAGGRRTGI